jgi:RNA polymerase sigma-70 factor (ECF subfamily)
MTDASPSHSDHSDEPAADTPEAIARGGQSADRSELADRAEKADRPEKADRIDERLLIASRSGDREAFRQLMERHREDLLRFLVRFLGSRSAADDVFQETFLQVHVAADTFDADRRFRPWLYAIAANKARDFHRRNKRRSAVSLSAPVGDGEASLIDMMAADAPSPEAPSSSAELQQSVKRVVDEMPSHYREILLLSYFQKMSYQQIAECLSIPLGTVKSRLHAAVANFASAWKATQPDDQSNEPE